MLKDLYKNHLSARIQDLKHIMNQLGIDRLIIDSGNADYYFLDDQKPSFRENPHFVYLCPLKGENHLIELTDDDKPLLHIYKPNDFWHQYKDFTNEFWIEEFNVKFYSDTNNLSHILGNHSAHIITPNSQLIQKLGFQPAGAELIHQINWLRTHKTDYEIQCLREASRTAVSGHQAARECFMDGGSELDIMYAYLRASRQREVDLPYNNIIALNQHGSILHYQNLDDHIRSAQSFLIDAGARYNGYCSDISRTYFLDQTHPVFKDCCVSIEQLKDKIISSLKIGDSYVDAHQMAMEGVTHILVDCGILKCDFTTAMELELGKSFFPHGVGHPLGIQVHDVGAKQTDGQGTMCEPNASHPFLRTLRQIEPNDVLTIEPGLYFISQFLEKLEKDKRRAQFVDWGLIQDLIKLGGIRFEDDVWISENGPVNLTKEAFN
jgi:Xaa-Pro dipeptidase